MSNAQRNVEAWMSEDGTIHVTGTHDTAVARKAAMKFLRDTEPRAPITEQALRVKDAWTWWGLPHPAEDGEGGVYEVVQPNTTGAVQITTF